MIQLLAGSLLLSLVHASIPNHWLSLVALSRAEKWPRSDTLLIAAITGAAHTLSTVLIGIIVGFAGYRLSSAHVFITSIAAPLILFFMGALYIFNDYLGKHNHDVSVNINPDKKKSKFSIAASLAAMMFFSPCIEIEAYYFTAGVLGWKGIASVSAVYIVITVSGMVLLVDLSLRGVEKLRWHFLEHHEKGLTGVILIILALFTYFVKL